MLVRDLQGGLAAITTTHPVITNHKNKRIPRQPTIDKIQSLTRHFHSVVDWPINGVNLKHYPQITSHKDQIRFANPLYKTPRSRRSPECEATCWTGAFSPHLKKLETFGQGHSLVCRAILRSPGFPYPTSPIMKSRLRSNHYHQPVVIIPGICVFIILET